MIHTFKTGRADNVQSIIHDCDTVCYLRLGVCEGYEGYLSTGEEYTSCTCCPFSMSVLSIRLSSLVSTSPQQLHMSAVYRE